MSKPKYTLAQVAQHNKDGDVWVVVDGHVYDLSSFADLHPGGRQVLLRAAGSDATRDFHVFHHPDVMRKYHPRLHIGDLVDAEQPEARPINPPGTFGDMIPYGDPLWYQRFNSPYYKQTHRDFRARVRRFVDTEILPTIDEWRTRATPPRELLLKMGQEGFLACMCGPPFPVDYVEAGVPVPDDFDYFHEFILFDELSRMGHSAAIGALTNGPSIALSAILRFGTDEMKRRVAPDVFAGRKEIALAISEPHAGSDVAGLVTTATRDGDAWLVNGNKKWITNGTYAEWFVTAVRTGAKGELTFLLVDKDTPGFSRRKLAIRDSDISGTAYLDFDGARVPVANTIGAVNQGFKLVMYNFNHERFYVSVIMLRLSRICIEHCVRWAMRRRAFGKPLSDVQSIRMKVADMGRNVELLQTFLETVTYQMCTMSHDEAQIKIGDIMCQAKAFGSKVFELCARETTMILGGNALYMNGVGKHVEPATMAVKGYQIPAGAEDVMVDFAGRSAFKFAAKLAKL